MPRVAVPALLALLLGTAVSASEAEDWLRRMAEALDRVEYRGLLVHTEGGRMQSLEVFHAIDPEGVRERLVALDGPPREIVQIGGRFACGGDASMPELGRLTRPAAPTADALAHYRLSLGGEERIAGLPARMIQLDPVDAFRYGHRLWLDQASGLPLRSLQFGADGRIVSQSGFVRIELGQRPSDAELGECPDPLPVDRAGSPAQVESRWRLRDGPPGFRLLRVLPLPGVERGEHQFYGDGLASVSVYIEPHRAEAAPLSGPARRGGINFFGRVHGGYQVTVVGEVPELTVQRVAQGMLPRDGSDG